MAKTAVVILNWNGRKLLERYLPSVIKFSNQAEVIIADNASTDDSVQWLKTNYPSLQIVINNSNGGYAGGYNQALKKIEADYFVLLNSDVEVTENWLQPLLDLMQGNDKIAACQPKLLWDTDREKFEYAGASGGFIDKYGYPFCRGRLFDELEKDSGQYESTTECFWASGACMMVRAHLYHQYGGLDEDFFAHMEEIDLCWRFKNSGYSIFVCPQSVVYHYGGGTLSQQNAHKTFLNFRNGLILLMKNLPVHFVFYNIPLRIFLDLLAALKFLSDGKREDFKAILSANWHFIIGIRKWWRKRHGFHHKFMTGVYDGSIVWNYFVKKKKKFSDLKF